MADKQLWQVVPVANDVKNDDGVIIGGQTAGTRYAPLTLIANFVHNLWAAFVNALTAKTSFANGDKFPVVNGSTATAMEADKLLELTAQNALADKLAQAFDSDKPNDDGGYAYYANDIVVYQGITYKFNVNHPSGAWNSSEVSTYDAGDILKFFIVTDNPEFLYAITDNEGAFLFGVKKDGSIEWQKGIPSPVYSEIKNILSLVSEHSSAITQLSSSKEDKAVGKSLIDETFSDMVSIVTNSEYIIAFLDNEGSILFGVKKDGSFDWQKGIPQTLVNFISNLQIDDASTKEYVDGKFSESKSYTTLKFNEEKQRASDAEQILQNQITNLTPLIINGGTFTNYPDDDTIEENNGLLSIKSISATLQTKGIRIVKALEDITDVITDIDTLYVIKNKFDLNGETLEIPSGCILDFQGGYIDNGTIVGDDTKVLYVGTPLGKDLVIEGTWNIPVIESSIVELSSNHRELKKLIALSSNTYFNVIHIVPGTWKVTFESFGEEFFSLKNNTKFVVDGNIVVQPNGFESYRVITATEKKNIEVCGCGVVSGDADNHDYTQQQRSGTHEWGHCLSFYFCENLFIHDLNVENATGDGFNAGGNNIVLRSIYAKHCGRQGLTISGPSENILIENCKFEDIYRTLPKAAIDVEPNLDTERVKNLIVRNVSAYDCYGGIQVWRTDGALIENVWFERCGLFVFGRKTKSMDVRYIRGQDNDSGASMWLYNDCEDCSIDDVNIIADNGAKPISFVMTGWKVKPNISFGMYSSYSGTPEEGSSIYDKQNHTLKYWNGSTWITF